MILNKAMELHGPQYVQLLQQVFSALHFKNNSTKDPTRPKRAMTAYLAFTMKNRAKVMTSFPDLKSTEVMKKLGMMWKEVSDEGRQQYIEIATQDKIRYETEMKAWKTLQNEMPGSRLRLRHDESLKMFQSLGKRRKLMKKARKKRDPTRPKRAMNSYNAFSKVKRAYVKENYPNIKPKEVMGILAELWKNTSDEEKVPFIQMAKNDKIRYATEMAEWKSKQKTHM